METKINKEIRSALEKFGNKYFIEDKVNKSKVIQDIDTYDKQLLSEFIHNETVKENFTIDIEGNIILQTNKLIELFEADEYWQDSYTKYSKKIGLTSKGKFITESADVVLDFPYKDTVLKASMSKEDTDKNDLRPDEPFLNEVIAKEEIDVLLDKKILVNVRKYSEAGMEEVDSFSEDDNLIIKGNNLLALHTLKEKFAGKVKMIYIDPPYNTGNDSFYYNDKFNHSSWLTFMKNRLEIAKELLSDTGSIFVQIDSFEDSYLKVLMDSIFGRENFRNKITWKRRGGSANPAKQLNNVVEYILWYSKDIELMEYEQVFSLNDENTQRYIKERFNNIDENGRKYMKSPIQSPNYRENLIYDYKGYKTPKKGYSVSREVMEKWDEEGRLAFPDSKDKNINRKIYLDEYKGQPINSLWTDVYVINPMSNERVEFLGGQKPEALIQRMMSMVTKENDIVLDFFMGSSTTQVVAHKMNRRYIGIEQMDYIETVSVPRLQKVIEGEQGGISKDVNWQGGGSFVYAELMEKNRGFLNSIMKASSTVELRKIFNFMLEEAEIDFRVDLEKVKETLHELSVDDQKRILIKIIDKNQLYYNYSEIDDENVRDLISENDYKFNKIFYEERGE
ncbi:DNA methyltransferase [Pseudobacillus badius]|uniref:DNA methyltransferase n=1 Tax=Bacillus badius TaxID=1455 RepID=UPI003CF0D05B